MFITLHPLCCIAFLIIWVSCSGSPEYALAKKVGCRFSMKLSMSRFLSGAPFGCAYIFFPFGVVTVACPVVRAKF